MRLIEIFAWALMILGMIVVVSMIINMFVVMFRGGWTPISVDFTVVTVAAVVGFASLIIGLTLYVLLRYVPTIIIEGEEGEEI